MGKYTGDHYLVRKKVKSFQIWKVCTFKIYLLTMLNHIESISMIFLHIFVCVVIRYVTHTNMWRNIIDTEKKFTCLLHIEVSTTIHKGSETMTLKSHTYSHSLFLFLVILTVLSPICLQKLCFYHYQCHQAPTLAKVIKEEWVIKRVKGGEDLRNSDWWKANKFLCIPIVSI